MQGKLLRQYREKIRAGTLTEPPNLDVLRSLKLLDRSALEHWLWAANDSDLCVLCGVCEGEPPTLPETLLLPHRLEPVIDRLRMELEDGPPNWSRQAPLHYALALAMDDPATLRQLLVTVEVRARSGVEQLEHLVMSPTARTRRVSSGIVRALCGRLPAGRGLRNAARMLMTRPLTLRAGAAVTLALAPVLAAEVVETIRKPGRKPVQLVERITEWLGKDGHTLRRALLQLLKHAQGDLLGQSAHFSSLVRYVGENDRVDDLVCVAILLRSFLETVSGPVYHERSWPPGPRMNIACDLDNGGRLAVLWAGPTGEASVWLTEEMSWQCRWSASGRPAGTAPVRALAMPEIVATGVEQSGIRTIEALERLDEKELYAMPGVGRTGVAAIREALASEACTLPEEEHLTIEGLRRFACCHLDEQSFERTLPELEALPRTIQRDLDQAGFTTLGEVLRWSSEELKTGAVLSPGRQKRLYRALRKYLAPWGSNEPVA